MAGKSEQKRLDTQTGQEQLANAAEDAALKEAVFGTTPEAQAFGIAVLESAARENEALKNIDGYAQRLVEIKAGETSVESTGAFKTAKEYPPIVRKQANRLLRLFQLPAGYEGRIERIVEYQIALSKHGVNPPTDEAGTRELIREVGEYNG